MAVFETIVRPAVVPNFRPPPAQKVISATVASTADPDKGFAVIHGNPAKQINLTESNSQSISRNQGVEQARRVDVMRVYQKTDDGTINKDNYVDVEVPNRIKMRDGYGDTTNWYRRAQEADNIQNIQRDKMYNVNAGDAGYVDLSPHPP